MKKSVIISLVKRNIETYGSLYGDPFNCVLCKEAEKRKTSLGTSECNNCQLWDIMPKPPGHRADCADIWHKGTTLYKFEHRLRGNKPALRALLNGLVNYFGKEEIKR